jgi:hypothetical protein
MNRGVFLLLGHIACKRLRRTEVQIEPQRGSVVVSPTRRHLIKPHPKSFGVRFYQM